MWNKPLATGTILHIVVHVYTGTGCIVYTNYYIWCFTHRDKSLYLQLLRSSNALNQPYTEITDGGANDSTNDTDIDNDTELIIELPSCVKTVKGG